VREPLIIVMKWKKHVQSNYFDYAKAGWGMVADGGDGLYVGVYIQLRTSSSKRG
jgi:hypothetical protein